MSTFVAAYLAVWLAVVGYVAWLGAGQRRQQRAIEALQSQFEHSGRVEDPDAKAA